jgi:hypothetical protein
MRRLGYTQFVAQGGNWCDHHGFGGRTGNSGVARHSLQHARRFHPRQISRSRSEARSHPISWPTKRACEQLAFVYKHVAYALRGQGQTWSGPYLEPSAMRHERMSGDIGEARRDLFVIASERIQNVGWPGVYGLSG